MPKSVGLALSREPGMVCSHDPAASNSIASSFSACAALDAAHSSFSLDFSDLQSLMELYASSPVTAPLYH
eukprot:3615452-Rhodomonas_salina.1